MGDGLTLEKLKIDERLRGVETHMEGNKITLHNIAESLTSLNLKVGIQNGRITKLENWKAYVLGGIGGVGGIFGIISLLISWIKH